MSAWSYSAITTCVTPAGTFTFNASSGDTFLLDPNACTGLGTSQVRTPIFNKGQTSGYNILPFFLEGQHLVLAGVALIRSAATEAGYVTARDVVLTDLRTKMKSIISADGTLTIGTDVLTVRCEHLPEISGGFEKRGVLGLVSASAA